MAREAQSLGDAQQILADLYPRAGDRLGDIRKECEQVLAFISDKGEFERAINTVSKDLWYRYSAKPIDEKNKFSTVLLEHAVTLGFPPQPLTILNAGDENYGSYLKQGWLIKDDMDLLHGEYSHTLQWFAVAAGLGPTVSVGNLYMKFGTSPYKTALKVYHYNKAEKTAMEGPVSLWAYLVDAFPMYMCKDAAKHNGGYSLFTDTYRCPQNLMKYLLNSDLPKNFLARYLQWRYLKRSFMQKSGEISAGGTIKNWADRAYKNNPEYTKMEGGYQSNRVIGGAAQPPRQYTAVELQKKGKETEVTFHGKTAIVAGDWDHI